MMTINSERYHMQSTAAPLVAAIVTENRDASWVCGKKGLSRLWSCEFTLQDVAY